LTTLNSKQYKEEERLSWDSVAAGWKKWWTPIERGTEKVSKRLIELAEIKPGSRVLDIATGIGEPSITAANLVGKSSGYVLATDISPQMLSIAKQRAKEKGLQDIIEFKVGDAETIDLPPSAFDAALCRCGLMFLPNLNAGLSNIHRSLKVGGHLAAAVWASPAHDTLSATTMNIVMKETGSEPPPPGTPGPFSLSDENRLKNSFMISGFKDLAIERIDVSFDFDTPEDFTAFITETAGPLQKMLASQTDEIRKKILKAVIEAARKYSNSSTGKVSFNNEAILIVSRK
jgi:ubiquinone/menaquinone biosynthesis C-methylase UbiE